MVRHRCGGRAITVLRTPGGGAESNLHLSIFSKPADVLIYSRCMPDEQANNNDNLDFEPEDELGSVGALQQKLAKLKDELGKVRKERQEYLEGWQRCKADSVNLKREAEARASRVAELLREELIHDIIPALDSFDMAAGSEAWASVSNGWRSGMEHVRDQLIEALRRHGIERIGKVGEPLNHAWHEVLEERDDVAGEEGTVARIVRFGYRTKERVLRPAHVVLKSSRSK